MAEVSAWLLACLALVPALAVPALAACRGDVARRLAGVQLVTAIAVLLLVAMTFAFDQSSFVDLALTLALLSLPSTLLIALFMERWL